MIHRRSAALAGLAGGAVAVGTSEFVAALTTSISPLEAVGSVVIDLTPTPVREWAIWTFGTSDKAVLRAGTLVVMALAAVLAGVRARTRRPALGATVVAFGGVGLLAVLDRPGSRGGAVLGILLGVLAGIAVGRRLVPVVLPGGVTEIPGESRAPLEGDRRQFLGSAAALGGAALTGLLAAAMRRRETTDAEAVVTGPLPEAVTVETLAPLPSGAEIHPTEPFLTPNADFYRIDTALSLPRADPADWTLRVDGLVDRPLTLSYADLQAMPQVEKVITLCCVSNEVGGKYVGTATWQGTLLRPLLEEAGIQTAAEQVFSTSIDGWTCGFPVAAALDGREAMVVLGMNGAPLPLEHGFPARLVVPGLYGYVSATKWLQSIELATWDRQGYWLPRGWSRLAPVKTQSRIDAPRHRSRIPAGPTAVAGVAWAPQRGIADVEVQVDDGPWQPARLGSSAGDDVWRQWVLEWDAVPGEHTIRVRATDGKGRTQTAERSPVAPDGATGHHTIRVRVD